MKKDGIQTRNRKVTAKSKKRKGGDFASMELFKSSFDKPFSTFPPPNFTPSMHHPSMGSYMNSGANFGHAHSSFPATHAHNASAAADISCRLGSAGYHGPMTS